MKYYIITRSEMELLEKAGIAVVACPKTKSGYDWSGVESITIEGKTYDSETHYKRHGNTGEFTSNGVVSYLESEDGDKIKLAPIRYTKKLAIKGFDDVEKIMKNTFHREEKMKKSYKDYPLIEFGYSDIASLVCVYFDNDENKIKTCMFGVGSDGSYRGRVVYNDVEIPNHYYKQMTLNAAWLKLYDDRNIVVELVGDAIYDLYTAGEHTVLINIKKAGI